MLERRLSVRELKDREILIGILKDTLPNLTEDERNTVCRTILRMIECIKVYGDGRILIIFGGGIQMEERVV